MSELRQQHPEPLSDMILQKQESQSGVSLSERIPAAPKPHEHQRRKPMPKAAMPKAVGKVAVRIFLPDVHCFGIIGGIPRDQLG